MRLHRSRYRARRRGFSLIETMVAEAITVVGLMGIAALQIISAQARTFSSNMATASLLAHDLADNLELWPYTDSRLTSLGTVTSTSAPTVTALWDMGTSATVSSGLVAEYSDQPNDPNAKTSSALGTTYRGITSPAGFARYWNVFGLDLAGTGVPQSKLVQIIVRWNDPHLGYRQVTFSTVVADPAALFQ